MTKGRLIDGVMQFNTRMQPYTPYSADLNPKKKIHQINQLIKTGRPKICIIRGEGIGDVIMTTPAIHELKNQFGGNCEITYATNLQYLDGALPAVLKNNPDIANIIDRANIDESDYNCVISLHCPAIAHEVPMAQPINRIDLFARHLGFNQLKNPVPRYFMTTGEYEAGSDYLYRNGFSGKKTMLVNLFASSPHRSVAIHTVRNALNRLYTEHKIHSLIVRHSSDASTEIAWDNIPGSHFINDMPIRELGGLMSHVDLLLCPDSALLHLGGAIGVPTVSLFGPTDPRARINYYSKAVAIWEGEKLGGHPHWYQACPQKGLCWKLITEQQIVDSCVSHIGSTARTDRSFILNRQ